VSEFYPPVLGGLELHVEALATALVARGHEVHVATLAPQARTGDDGVTVHVLAGSLGAAANYVDRSRPYHPPVADPRVTRGLARLTATIAPDVIHAHGPMAASLPGRGQRPPLVYTAHDYALVCVKRSLLNASGDICEGPALARCVRCSADHFGPVRGSLMALAGTRTAGAIGADTYMAVSESVAAAIRPAVGAVRVVPNFVPDDADGHDEPVAGLPAGPFVMFAGAPSPHKGLHLLMDLWAGPGMPVPLVVASTGGELTAPPGVTVLRLTRRQTMLAWRNATLAAVPSLWADPCPTVAIEAMLTGTPVVASAVGGLPFLVPHQRAGLCVAPGDPVSLRDALISLLADGGRREAMGRYGRHWARQFLASRVVPRIEAVYEELLVGHRVGASGTVGGRP